jgi:hypothetical protein
MKLYTPDGQELMDIKAIRRQGNDIVVDGIIMGAMPAIAVMRPDEARSIFSVLSAKLIPFLLSFIFRSAGPKPAALPNPLEGLLDDY